MNRYYRVERLKELLGVETALDEMCQVMSAKELEKNLDHIEQMHDIESDGLEE